MKHTYRVFFAPSRTHTKKKIKELVSRYSSIELNDDVGDMTVSENGRESLALVEEAKRLGFKCDVIVRTEYGYNDALKGDLGILWLGPASTTHFRATLPKDAFPPGRGCPRCGLGAAAARPHLLSQRAIRSRGNFYEGLRSGSSIIFMRSEIGRAIIDATGRPSCLRHPVTRSGAVVEEWMEAVPQVVMSPLSPQSEGVLHGTTKALSRAGEPPRAIPPCPVCGRQVWAEALDTPTRLVYPRAAVAAAQEGVVAMMYEPMDIFPTFDPARNTFKAYYGFPLLVFSRAAVEVLLKYTQDEHIRDSSSIQPVYSEA